MLSNKTIGEQLKKCRKASGENQEDIAKLLNVQRQIISYYETGARTPNIEDLAILAKHFDTTVDYLIGVSEVGSKKMEPNAIHDYTGLSEEAINKLHENFAVINYSKHLKKEGIEKLMRYDKQAAEILSALIVGNFKGSLISSVFHLAEYLEKDREMTKRAEEINNGENFSEKDFISFMAESNIREQLKQLRYYEAIDDFKYAVDEYLKRRMPDNEELYDNLAKKFRGEADGEHN